MDVDLEQYHEVSIPYKSGQHFKCRLGARGYRHPVPQFQSPTNRVNTSNVRVTQSVADFEQAMGFNPLQIGSTLQMQEYDYEESTASKLFQSPTNRVNTSNRIITHNTQVSCQRTVSIPYKSGQHFK